MGGVVWSLFDGWRLEMEEGGIGWCDGPLRVWVWDYVAEELPQSHDER